MANSHNNDCVVLHFSMTENHFIQTIRALEYTTDSKFICPGIYTTSILHFCQNLQSGLFLKRIYKILSLQFPSNM
jgi:hypothetical protein